MSNARWCLTAMRTPSTRATVLRLLASVPPQAGGLLLAVAGIAQSDRGIVTGTVADPAGAVVPNAAILLENVDTGSEFQSITTDTGNFTVPFVPAGNYEMTVSAPGFSKHIQRGIQVQVALTVRLDVTLKLGGGAGSIGAIRNQMAFVVLSPGVSGSGAGARINGFIGNTFRVMIEGQDTTSGNTQSRVGASKPPRSAMQAAGFTRATPPGKPPECAARSPSASRKMRRSSPPPR